MSLCTLRVKRKEREWNMRSINKREFTAGTIVLLVVLIGGGALLGESALIYRMLVGLGLGYTLTRAL